MSSGRRYPAARVWRRPLLAPARVTTGPRRRCEVCGPDGFVGHLIFEKQAGFWRSVDSSENLTYLRRIRADEVRLLLEKEGCWWRWLSPA